MSRWSGGGGAGAVERMANLPTPVVAAMRGHCRTGGLELVFAADINVCGEGVKFADTHAKWDLVPISGLSQRLPRRMGIARAREMMFASRIYCDQSSPQPRRFQRRAGRADHAARDMGCGPRQRLRAAGDRRGGRAGGWCAAAPSSRSVRSWPRR